MDFIREHTCIKPKDDLQQEHHISLDDDAEMRICRVSLYKVLMLQLSKGGFAAAASNGAPADSFSVFKES